jgi:hypothetical protein
MRKKTDAHGGELSEEEDRVGLTQSPYHTRDNAALNSNIWKASLSHKRSLSLYSW